MKYKTIRTLIHSYRQIYTPHLANYMIISFANKPSANPSNMEANVPNKKYSAQLRSSNCLKRAIDFAAIMNAIDGYAPTIVNKITSNLST